MKGASICAVVLLVLASCAAEGPNHAAFPSLVGSTGGGLLTQSPSPDSLAESLRQVLLNPDLRTSLAIAGYRGVRQKHDLSSLAAATIERVLGRMKLEG